jgi:hypothetical protein
MPNRLPSILFLVLSIGTTALPVGGAAQAQVAADAPKNVLEFYKLLPDKYFEADREQRTTTLLDPKQGSIVDIPNGYLYAQGDGAQGSLWVCVFKRPDRSYLMAVKFQPPEDERPTLDFYEWRDGGLQPVERKRVLPVAFDGRLTYQMPRQGRTIKVVARDGKRLYDLTWVGVRFEKRQPEK